jgi:hypothetical protein
VVSTRFKRFVFPEDSQHFIVASFALRVVAGRTADATDHPARQASRIVDHICRRGDSVVDAGGHAQLSAVVEQVYGMGSHDVTE